MTASSEILIRLDRWGRACIPAFVLGCLVFAELLPWGPRLAAVLPSLPLMAVFYWAVRAQALCPPLLALVAGLFADLAELTPFGCQGFLFVAVTVFAGARRRRMIGQTFLGLWLTYGLIAFLCLAFIWVSGALIRQWGAPLSAFAARYVLGIALFPVVTRLLLMPVERLVPEAPLV